MHDDKQRIIGTVRLVSAGTMFAALMTGSKMILVMGMCMACFAVGMSVMRPK